MRKKNDLVIPFDPGIGSPYDSTAIFFLHATSYSLMGIIIVSVVVMGIVSMTKPRQFISDRSLNISIIAISTLSPLIIIGSIMSLHDDAEYVNIEAQEYLSRQLGAELSEEQYRDMTGGIRLDRHGHQSIVMEFINGERESMVEMDHVRQCDGPGNVSHKPYAGVVSIICTSENEIN